MAGLLLVSWPWWSQFGPVRATEKAPVHAEEVRIAQTSEAPNSELQTATFGGGCFWCLEAIFQELDGVRAVVSGYSGDEGNPTSIVAHNGPAEVVQITFDSRKLTYAELLEIYWRVHDPTTLNRQGPDVGTKYRSVIFYHDNEQRRTAEAYKHQLDESGVFGDPIVTDIEKLEDFTAAENFHQNFFSNRPDVPYCRLVVGPKLEKFRKEFAPKLRESPAE